MVKKILNNFLNILENNEYLILYITSIIILYVCFLGEEIPYFIENIFKNKIVKILAILLIIFRAENNTFMSVMYTLAFLVTIDKSSVNKVNKIKKKQESEEKKIIIQNEAFAEKQYTKNEILYKNEMEKLIKMKEKFSETNVDDINVLNCKTKYTDYIDDFSNTNNTNYDVKMVHIENRCSNEKFPNPDELLNSIEVIEEKFNKNNDEIYKEKLEKDKYKYNTYRQIFRDYKNYEEKNKERIKKLTWIKKIIL